MSLNTRDEVASGKKVLYVNTGVYIMDSTEHVVADLEKWRKGRKRRKRRMCCKEYVKSPQRYQRIATNP